MRKITFAAWGHENISAEHKTTLEFTKDDHVTPSGDCIVGIAANFDTNQLEDFVKEYSSVRISLRTGALKEVIHAKTNPKFTDFREMVVRMGEHDSSRTFAVRADRAAKHLSREFIRAIRTGSPMEVDIEAVE